MVRRRRLVLYALLAAVIAVLGLFGYLWVCADYDLRFVLRVLIHRDASTDDYRWKASAAVAPPPSPVRWREAPECPRVEAAVAAETDGTAMADYLGRGGALALVVIRDGALACEWYGNGGARDRPAAAFSVSKTVVSLVVARAIADRTLGAIDDPITRYVPELAARDPRFTAISLANLVDMRSGIAFREDAEFPWVDQDAPRVYYASDLARTVIERPRIEAPPGPFVYNDYAPNLVGLALERATGRRLAEGPMQALWAELGAEYPARWSVDDHGFAWHESGLVVTARDLARIGQLILDGGKVADRQVAPAAWLARSLDPAGREVIARFAALGYRNGWWVLGDRALAAMGRHGQIMIVAPGSRTVIVRLGLDGHDETNASIAQRLERVAARLAR